MERANDEDLLGYTLGALEPDEQDRVGALVREDQRLQLRVEVLRNRLARLDELQSPGKPPAGLARRTCERIAAVPLIGPMTVDPNSLLPRSAPVPRPRPIADRLAFVRRSPLELAVAAVVILLLGSLGVMALGNMRENSRIAACQNNMRQVGLALLEYSSLHGGVHLAIPEDSRLAFAGAYGPLLIESGLVKDSSLFYCAGGTRRTDAIPPMPTLEQILQSEGADLARLKRSCGGDFAYNIGHVRDGKYTPPKNLNRPDYALLADNPNPSLAGRRSSNHGGKGQNVFFEDGHIEFLADPLVNGDSIYENDEGAVRPGVSPNDCVLGPSTMLLKTPLIITD